MSLITEPLHPGAFIVSEECNYYSRDEATVDASVAVPVATVLGARGTPSAETATAVPATGNTGNGVFTLDGTAPIAASAKYGKYTVMCITAVANGGLFQVEDPAGVLQGEVAVGATFNGPIKFAIADGATDFVIGDKFYVTVAREEPGDSIYAPLNFAATDGSDAARAVLIYPINASEAGAGTTKKRSIISRHAEVRDSDLVWPAGATAAQKAVALAQLRTLGIVSRS